MRGVSYRPPSHQPRGAWARHLHEQRRLRDLSQTQAFELVYERVGWSSKSRTAYVAIDMGERQPKEHEAAVLGAEFGWPAEQDASETPPGIPELVAALAAQTTAINALVERLGSMAGDSIASAVRQAVVEAGLLQGDGDSPGAQPPAPSL